MKRKLIVYLSIFIAILVLLFVVLVITGTINFNKPNKNEVMTPLDENQTTNGREVPKTETDYVKNLKQLLAPDSIPPLEEPEFLPIEEINYLVDEDLVFVLESESMVYVYPRKIMVWHEIVNQEVNGEAISITYCPLTGSTIAYKGDVEEHNDNTYGTSGSLVNSNLVLYDRLTESYIPQILGEGINGDLEGSELDTVPVYWVTWEKTKESYPDAMVLSLKTGFSRDYFDDPYGTYSEDSTNSYYLTGEPNYNVINDNDGTYDSKKVVIGIKHKNFRVALNPIKVKSDKVVSFMIGDIEAVAFFDNSIDSVRVFKSYINDRKIEFNYVDSNIIDENQKVWTPDGKSEDGLTLEYLTHFEVMWFAWYAYYPDTIVID